MLFMLHKKGSVTDPFNYRGIALINGCIKIFTQILQRCIYKWAIALHLIPEEQSGFLEGKGTADNIFSLQTAIHMRLRLDKGKVYALFVDFQKACDSVSHEKLWAFFYEIGLSPKLLRILMSFYNQAASPYKRLAM